MTSTAIAYSLRIGGSAAPSSVIDAIRSLEVEDHAGLADMLRLRLAVNVKADGSGWTILDDGVFSRLDEIRVNVTIGSGNAIPLMTGRVIETSVQFANEPGGSVMTVIAMDPTVLMHLEEKVKAWPNMADSDVASAIFGDGAYRFSSVVEATRWTRNEADQTLMQRGTDIAFLQMLAGRNGYECYVELNPSSGEIEGHFHPSKPDGDPQGTLSVNMGSATNVAKFKARYDMLGPTQVKAATVDPDDASGQQGESENTSQSGLGREESTASDRPRTVLLSQLAMAQSGEVQRYAQAVVDRSAWAIVAEGELSTATYGGILRAKRPVLVRGAGREFSGRYYVERVLHSIGGDGSYTQRFTVRRNAVGLTGRERFSSQTALAS
jgi:phage protein D